MVASGSSLVAVPDGGQSVTAPRQAARCPLLPAGLGWGWGHWNVQCLLHHQPFLIRHIRTARAFLMSCVDQYIFNNFPSQRQGRYRACNLKFSVDHINSILSPKRWFLVLTCVLRCGCGPVNCAIECVRRYKLSTCLYFSRGFCCTHCTRTWEKYP